MSYATGETALLAVVRTCTGFSSTNTSQCNWKLLNQGKASEYVILRPGAFAIEWITMSAYVTRYTTVIELWERYKDDSTTYTNLYANIAALMTGIQPERLLNTAGIQDSTVSGASAPQEMWKKGGGPQWLKWELTVSWQEETIITFTD
jgi:hypothetical protein